MILANIFGPDLGYVVIILLAVILGGSQLPKIARNVGVAGKEFRQAQREADEEEAQHRHAAEGQPPAQPAPLAPAPPATLASGVASPENQASPGTPRVE